MQTGTERVPGLYIWRSEVTTKAGDFFSQFGILSGQVINMWETLKAGQERGGSSQSWERARSRENEPKIPQRKIKGGENFQGLLNFAIGSSLLITKAIMFFMPGKDHTHTRSHISLTTSLEVCATICRTVPGVAKGKIQTTEGWEVT